MKVDVEKRLQASQEHILVHSTIVAIHANVCTFIIIMRDLVAYVFALNGREQADLLS